MFRMKVECQFNIEDRTLICGIPEYDVIPEPNDISVKKKKRIRRTLARRAFLANPEARRALNRRKRRTRFSRAS